MSGRAGAAVLSVLLCAGFVFFGQLSSPAFAACADEESIFGYDYNTSTAYATANTFDVRDRDLSGACIADAEAHSTAHVENTAFSKQAEVGWHEYWFCSRVCVHGWNAFWEVQIGSFFYGDLFDGPGLPTPGAADPYRFKVEYNYTVDAWKFYYDPGANGGYIQIGPSNGQNAGFAHGYPMG